MTKTERKRNQEEKTKYRMPHKVQDLISVDKVFNDGIFQHNDRYSKMYRFSDINFITASDDNKEIIMEKYIKMICSIDSEATVKLTINNEKLNKENFEKNIKFKKQNDSRDVYVDELNDLLIEKVNKEDCIIQDRYFTITVTRKNIKEAREFFKTVSRNLDVHLKGIHSKVIEVSVQERLYLLHNFFRNGEENSFHYDPVNTMIKGHNFKDYICPDSMEIHSDYFMIGDRYARVMYLKEYASYIDDGYLQKIMSVSKNTMLSMDIYSIPTAEAVRFVQNKMLAMDTDNLNWQRRQYNNNNFAAQASNDYLINKSEHTEVYESMMKKDERMLQVLITMVITANSKEELDRDTKNIQTLSLGINCQLVPLRYRQIDGMKTVLPLGIRKINDTRTIMSSSLATFVPFKVQEIMEKGGIYFGENAVSHNLIMCNRALLMNQSAIVLGIPGSGKSFTVKSLIMQLLLTTDDDIIVCDPEGEYIPIAKILGSNSAIVNISAGGKNKINAMYTAEGYGDGNPIAIKTQFIISLIEQFDKGSISSQHKSIIDRCIKNVYKESKRNKTVPTLCTLRDRLMEQPEDIAHDIALSLELYTEGSLDIFGHESNIDMDKRMVVFDIHELSEQLKGAGLLVITDTMLNRVTQNWKKGKRTHVFIDEFHVVFDDEHSAAFFESVWRQFRKRNAYPTAITQNVTSLLDSGQATSMLSNSEFIIMLNQSPKDRDRLADLLDISNEQLRYITNVDSGSGLIRYGSVIVPFINKYPTNTKIYDLMTTRPGEGAFAEQAE